MQDSGSPRPRFYPFSAGINCANHLLTFDFFFLIENKCKKSLNTSVSFANSSLLPSSSRPNTLLGLPLIPNASTKLFLFISYWFNRILCFTFIFCSCVSVLLLSRFPRHELPTFSFLLVLEILKFFSQGALPSFCRFSCFLFRTMNHQVHFVSRPKTPHQSKNPRAFPLPSSFLPLKNVTCCCFAAFVPKKVAVAVRHPLVLCSIPLLGASYLRGHATLMWSLKNLQNKEKQICDTTLHWQLRGELKVSVYKLHNIAIHTIIRPSEDATKANKID